MTGREMEAQRREIFGARVGYCDLCGAAAPLTELREIDGGPMAYGADFEPTVICQGCLERIYKGELEKRPKIERKVYRILTLGMKATGKSSLTLKWANPLVDLGTGRAGYAIRRARLRGLRGGRAPYGCNQTSIATEASSTTQWVKPAFAAMSSMSLRL